MKIKTELQDKYNNYVKINKEVLEEDRAYGMAVIDCTEIFGNFVDQGKTFDEAERAMLDTPQGNSLTGFMMGCIMQVMVAYHPRGDEIKKWWNKEQGGTGEEKGTINPALMTINIPEKNEMAESKK